jgi:hypothetical protein
MVSQINKPTRKSDQLALLGTLGGAGVGAAVGGPGGALLGSQIGGQLGGAAEAADSGNDDAALLGGLGAVKSAAGAGVGGQPAMQRRLDGGIQEDPAVSLENASVALTTQPPEIQQKFGPQISQALALSRRQRGIA